MRSCPALTRVLVAVAVLLPLGAAQAAPGDAVVPPAKPQAGTVLVKWKDSPQRAALEQAAAPHRVWDVRRRGLDKLGMKVYRVPDVAAAVQRLRGSSAVASVEADAKGVVDLVPNDPSWPQQWGPQQVGAPAAWDSTTGSSAVTVAVLDSGVQPHSEMTIASWRDYIAGKASPYDDRGHGTRAAGIAVATGGNGSGIAGLCWSCRIDVRKVVASDGSVQWSTLAAAVVDATDAGADVITMSLSGTVSTTALSDAMAYAAARDVVLVSSAGNVGDTAVRYPAAYSQVLGVAGNDIDGNRYSWSSHGSWVKLTAPGCGTTTDIGGGYTGFCGTSAATPLVAGTAALLKARGLSAAAARDLLLRTAKPASFVSAGRVDAAAAMAAAGGTTTTAPAPSPAPTASPSPSPTPTSSAEPTTTAVTTVLSGTISKGAVTRDLAVGAGGLAVRLAAPKATSLRLRLLDPRGAVLRDLQLQVGQAVDLGQVSAGTHAFELSGTRTGFELSVLHARP